MGWGLKTGRRGRSTVTYPRDWQTQNGELCALGRYSTFTFYKTKLKRLYFWQSQWKGCRSSQVSKGPGEGAGSGVARLRKEQNDVTLRAREGTVWVPGLREAKAGVEFPRHGNMQSYWETIQTSPGLTKQKHSNKMKQVPRMALSAETPCGKGAAEFQLIICRIPDNSWSTLGCFDVLSRNGFEVRALRCLFGLSTLFHLQQKDGKTK